jgi:hypothetical protein
MRWLRVERRSSVWAVGRLTVAPSFGATGSSPQQSGEFLSRRREAAGQREGRPFTGSGDPMSTGSLPDEILRSLPSLRMNWGASHEPPSHFPL